MKISPVKEVSYEEITRLMEQGVGSPIIWSGGIDIVADGVTYSCNHIPAAPLDTRHSTDWETAINSGI